MTASLQGAQLADAWPWGLGLLAGMFVLVRAWKFLPSEVLRPPKVRAFVAGESSGLVMLEFILMLPIFAGIVMTVVQLAVLLNAQLVVTHAAFCAARSAIVFASAPVASGDEVDAQERAERAVGLALMPIAPKVRAAHFLLTDSKVLEESLMVGLMITNRMQEDAGPRVLPPYQRVLGLGDPDLATRGWRAGMKYIEARRRTTVSSPAFESPPGPSDLVEVTIVHEFYLSVPFGSTIFDKRTPREKLLGLVGGGLLGHNLPYANIRARSTLLNQGKQEGRGCP